MTDKTHQSNNRQTTLLSIGAILIIVTVVGGVFLWKSVQSTMHAVQNIGLQVSSLQSQDRTPTSDQLKKAVALAITDIAAEEQAKLVTAKLDAYKNAAETVPDGKHVYGSLNARFTMVEFSDLECPYCKRFHNTPKSLVDDSSGNVNWQWMHLPLGFHNPGAQLGAEAAECASDLGGNRSFWAYLEEYFEHTRGNGQGVSDLTQLAVNLGINATEFRQCMTEGRYRDKVQEQAAKAASLGINGTPATFLVDNLTGNSQLLSGAQPAEAFVGAMRKMITEAQEAATAKQG